MTVLLKGRCCEGQKEQGNKGRKKESWWLRLVGNLSLEEGLGLWEAGQAYLKGGDSVFRFRGPTNGSWELCHRLRSYPE